MKAPGTALRTLATGLVLLLSAGPFAAEAPVLDSRGAMSLEVGLALNEVITLNNARQFEAAAAALQSLRDTFADRLNAYEKLRLLLASANLNTSLQKYPEALADYGAILQMEGVPEAERLAATDNSAQLFIEQADWSQALEYLLNVNTIQGGSKVETLMRIASVYSQLDQFAEAVPYQEKALALAAAQATEEDRRNLAALYIQAGQTTQAIATYEELLEAYPDSANRETMSANLAALYIEVRETVKARVLLRNLIREFPDSERLPTYRQSLSALEAARR